METKVVTKEPQEVSRLERLGFTKASARIKELSKKSRKMAMAYEIYRFVRQEKFDGFNERLKKKTMQKDGSYQKLAFTPIDLYQECPPADVLDLLEKAVNLKVGELQVFDRFEIAHIVDVKDPILFGRVDGCSDRFIIGQWDDDIHVEDLLAPNEG